MCKIHKTWPRINEQGKLRSHMLLKIPNSSNEDMVLSGVFRYQDFVSILSEAGIVIRKANQESGTR